MDSSMDSAGRSSPWTPASLALSRLSLTRFAKLENIRWRVRGNLDATTALQLRCNLSLAGPRPATSAPGRGSLLPHLHRDGAHSCHICTGTGLTLATCVRRALNARAVASARHVSICAHAARWIRVRVRAATSHRARRGPNVPRHGRAACDRLQAGGQDATCNRRHATCNRRHATCDTQHAT
jgi:hypothetical protein